MQTRERLVTNAEQVAERQQASANSDITEQRRELEACRFVLDGREARFAERERLAEQSARMLEDLDAHALALDVRGAGATKRERRAAQNADTLGRRERACLERERALMHREEPIAERADARAFGHQRRAGGRAAAGVG